MDVLLKILEIVPPFEFIESFLIDKFAELTITKQFYEIVDQLKANKQMNVDSLENAFIMVAAVKDHLWEIINTGHFSKVDKIARQMFTIASLQKAILLLIREHLNLIDPDEATEKCMWELDNGLLLGCPLTHPVYCNVLSDCLTMLQNGKTDETETIETTTLNTKHEYRPVNDLCDIDIVERPSIQYFKENHFNKSEPVILKNCMNQWPAMLKWNKSDYLLEICRNRVVPIEIGKNYTNENWSQDLVKFEDFYRRQFLENETGAQSKRIEYLAQHNLFDQIPTLKNDIPIPEYCCTTNTVTDDEIDVDIKAWLGPEGTTSPMHIDQKHNLLCQIFGSKRIILAAPKDSVNLYPFDGDMLKNTSQIDADHLDYDRFPLLRNVKFYTFTLYTGEMLYIPPKWWHFVRSLSKSFSVSFWWE